MAWRASFAAFSMLTVVLLVRRAGSAWFCGALRAALPWLPLLLGLEAVRIAADLVALRLICGSDARRVPLASWLRLQLGANAALVVLPGGRAVSEGMKISYLMRIMSPGRAVAIVGSLHVTTLLGIVFTSIAAAFAAWWFGADALAVAIAIHGSVCGGLALILHTGLRRAALPRALSRWIRSASVLREDLRAMVQAQPRLRLAAALAAKIVSRSAQGLAFAILLVVLGAPSGLLRGTLASGVNLLGGAVSDLSLASLGVIEGAFAAFAEVFRLDLAGAIALANLARFVSLVWSAIGVAVWHSSLAEPLSRSRSELTLGLGDSHA